MLTPMILRWLVVVVGLWTATFHGWAQGKSQVRLLLDSAAVKPGSALYAAVELTPPKGWHTYWRYPGDSGQRTKIEWSLPEGITAGDILWPVPVRHTESDLTTYVYEGPVLLPVRLTVSPSRPAGPVTVSAKVSWLECDKECVPGRSTISNLFTIGATAIPSAEAPTMEQTLARIPRPDPSVAVTAAWEGPGEGDQRPLLVTVPRVPKRTLSAVFPYEVADADVAPAPELLPEVNGSVPVRMMVTRTGAEWPTSIRALLLFGASQVIESQILIGATVPVAAIESPPEAPVGAPVSGSLWAMLGVAFVGGLILNIMPCVLPVIALKILGFVKQSREQPGRVRFLGLVYTLGVLASFPAFGQVIKVVTAASQLNTRQLKGLQIVCGSQ